MSDDLTPPCPAISRSPNGDFAALFAQLDRPEAAAPLDTGLVRLITRLNEVDHRPALRR